jgi:protease-4
MSKRNIVTRLFSALWAGADNLRKILHLLVLLFIFSILISLLSSSTGTVPASAALVISPAGSLVEQLAGDPFDRALAELVGDAEPQTLVKDIVDGLNYAKNDDRITMVLLDLSAMPGGGLSKLQRVGDAIDDFRQSGKPVIATADYYSQGSYYLASHADEITMHPDGIVILSGFGAYLNFYKSALDKLRIDWNIFRVGTYKAAVEPYMRNDMSEDYRESMGAVLEQLWSQYMTDIETARGLDEGTVADLLENLLENVRATNGDLAKVALDAGFIDELMTREQLQQRVIEIAGTNGTEDDYPSTGLDDYLMQMRLLHGDKTADQNVAIIVASGEILNGSQPPGTIGGDSTASLLREARKDDSVKAVVFRVDSPGGSAFASELILNEIEEIKAAGKPVVVSMSSVAASGGYWVSMAADSIYASPYTITGSIGIFGMFPTFQRTLDTLGISTDGVGTTTWAGELRPDREMSEDMKTLFQVVIEKGYDDFISGVATHRGLSREDVDAMAQGRIWTATDAYEKGLIDGLGDIDQAIAAAAELAKLPADEYGRKYFEQALDPGEKFMLDLMGAAKEYGLAFGSFGKSRPSVEHVADILDDALSPLVRFNDPRGMYSHCFCAFE